MSWLDNRERIHSAKEIFRILKPYLLKRPLFLLFVSIVSFVAALIGLITPQLIRYIVDDAIPKGNLFLLWILGLSVLLVAIIAGLMQFISRYYAALLAQKITLELRDDIYELLQQLTMEYYDEESTGQIMTRVTTDLNAISSFISFTLRLLLNGVILFVGSYTAMIVMSWKLGLIMVGFFPVFIWLVFWFSNKVRPIFYKSRTQFGVVTSVLQENVTGIHVVRGFAQEENEIEKFTSENAKYMNLRIKAQVYRSIYFGTMTLLIGLGTSLVLFLGGFAVTDNTMKLGVFLSFIFYLMILPMPTRQLTMVIGVVQRALASGDRLMELLSAKREIQEDPDAIIPPKLQGKINYENVWFEYEKNKPILRNINIGIPSGQKIVLMGGTGSGKSSFVSLLQRFYDPNQGEIKIDGINIRNYQLKPLRKQIGLVLQDTFLFNDSIKENIAFGKPNASEEEIEKAARTANIHDFIISLPDGYDTRVGDRGITLSGGQKQRISIARTLLTDPSLLIFDDSTASVDAETEAQIQESLDILSKGRTTIIISQRISSVKYADRILVFDEGEIIQDGNHDDLINQKGLYQEIYTTLAKSYDNQKVTQIEKEDIHKEEY